MSSELDPSAPPRPRVGPGLKLRLWAACLAGALVAALGLLWVLASPELAPSDPVLIAWLAGIACGSLLLGLAAALWVDHHLLGRLQGVLLGLRTGRVAELRGLPAGTGWGELSELSDAVQEVLERGRRESRAHDELDRTRDAITALTLAIEHWRLTEQWLPPALPAGEVADAAERLTDALARREQVDQAHREAAQRVAAELATVLAEAHEAASQAERGFVEATALQTSVREVQRLSGELASALGTTVGESSPGERARLALEELVASSAGSVEALGRGLLRVHDVTEQVQRLANRATLIAIQTLSGTQDPTAFAAELQRLSADVREATDLVQRYASDIADAVRDADAAMRTARERALAKLEPPVPAAPRGADAERLLERVLEMVQDATAKGERVSTAAEKASSAAARLSRRLEGGVGDAAALSARLAPVGNAPATVGDAPAPATPALWLVDPTAFSDAATDKPDAREGDRP
jgi:hypothetical protein